MVGINKYINALYKSQSYSNAYINKSTGWVGLFPEPQCQRKGHHSLTLLRCFRISKTEIIKTRELVFVSFWYDMRAPNFVSLIGSWTTNSQYTYAFTLKL